MFKTEQTSASSYRAWREISGCMHEEEPRLQRLKTEKGSSRREVLFGPCRGDTVLTELMTCLFIDSEVSGGVISAWQLTPHY